MLGTIKTISVIGGETMICSCSLKKTASFINSIALDVGRMSARYRPGAPIDKAKKNRHLNFMGVLENQCLVLNRSWQAVNVITVQAALSMMAADAATGMNFTEGNFVPVRWNDWLAQPSSTGRGRLYRHSQPASSRAEGHHSG
jgi:hypothetical protein